MLAQEIVAEARRLLAQALPQREVYRRMNGRISRGSLHRLAAGKYRDRGDDDPDPPPGPGIRCPSCGASLVALPCIACAVRARAEVTGDDGEEEPTIQLRPAERARYEEIRRGRAA